jgi:hypothetical protein
MASELEKLIAAKVEALQSVPDMFASGVVKAQEQAFRAVLGLLNSLETVDGQIVFNTNNLAIIGQIREQLRASLSGGEYRESLRAYLQGFANQAEINAAFVAESFGSLSVAAEVQALLSIAQRDAIAALGDAAIETRLLAPLSELLTQSVTTGASLRDAIKTVQDFIVGTPEIDGKLLSYARTISDTTFSVFDRSYTQALTKDLDVQWYFYAGGEIATTRKFCCQRAGHYYTKEEVESWGSKTWAGQIAGTNSNTIFAFAGGWNCRHTIMPVSESSVPERYKDGAIYDQCS